MKVVGEIKADAFLCQPLLYGSTYKAMAAAGVDWQVNCGRQEGDVAICTTDELPAWANFEGPLILYDYNDIEVLTCERRELLLAGQPNRYVWKSWGFSDPAMQNALVWEGSVHGAVINGSGNRLTRLDDLSRLMTMSVEIWHHYFDAFFDSHGFDTLDDRPVDVMFAGTTDSGNYPAGVAEHRSRLLDQMGMMPRRASRLFAGRRAFTDNRSYIAALARSKAVISPWGHGVHCHRDLEAVLCGCVLIKPRCLSHEEPYVNIYCDHYFDSLDQIWESELMSERQLLELEQAQRGKADWLRAHRTPDHLAKAIVTNILESVL